ncbi:MAG: hypothetical protein NXI31_02860 [bacterium]|nr:hypothetical protein [bacterium]
MKLETLRNVLERHSRIKLYIVSDSSCACTHVSQPLDTDDGLRLLADSLLRVSFDSMAMSFDPFGDQELMVSSNDRFTRRLHTHRRHLRGIAIPPDYLRRAAEL